MTTATESFAPTWFVTGAATGFGREIVMHALAAGANVVATARDPAKLADMAHDRLLALALDVTDPAAVTAAVAAAEARFGRIDVLVNNAGYGLIAAVEEATDAETRILMETHFFGSVALIRAVLPGMRARRHGHIVNFSSVAGVVGFSGTALYAAAKFAIEGLSEGLAKELAPLGIKVTIIEPGPFQTNFFTTSRRMGATIIADYDGTAGAYRKRASKPDPWLPGDPARAAAAIAAVVADRDPPLRLLLGQPAYDMITAKLASHAAEIERWKVLSLSADRPDAAGRSWP